jgi:hypothetical protein
MNAGNTYGQISSAAPAARSADRSRARRASSFVALLGKDLRLSATVSTIALAVFVALIAVIVILPAIDPRVGAVFGLAAWQDDALRRLGAIFQVLVVLSVFVGGIAAAVLADGDRSGGGRCLMASLPVPASLSLASKLCASAIVLAVLLVPSIILQSVFGRWNPLDQNLVRTAPALIGIVLVWPLAAPLFARSSGYAFVVALFAPPLLVFGSVACALAVVPLAIERALLLAGAESWATLVETRAFSYEVPQGLADRALPFAAVIALALAILGAWRARNFVACRQTHRTGRIRRALELAGISAVAVGTTTAAVTAATWNGDPMIARILARAELLEKWRALSNHDLIVEGQDALFRPGWKEDEPNPEESAWETAQSGWHANALDYGDSDYDSRRDEQVAIDAVLYERKQHDTKALLAAATELIREADGRIGRNLAFRLLGDHQKFTHALQILPSVTDEAERARLVSKIAEGVSSVWWTSSAAEPTRRKIPAAALRESFDAFDKFTSSVVDRMRAAIVLEVLRRDLEAGTLEIVDPGDPEDRLEIDAAMLQRAREAVELPFPELARAAGATERLATDVAKWTDDDTLYLRTSELFDPAKTDPSYLLPRR